jgi:hypothetical protein
MPKKPRTESSVAKPVEAAAVEARAEMTMVVVMAMSRRVDLTVMDIFFRLVSPEKDGRDLVN